jgi:hypothetical protein
LAPDEPGREILYPVATVIIGGLISSTLLDFLVTPAVFWSFGRKDAERLAAARHREDKAAQALAVDLEEPSVQPTNADDSAKGGLAHV